MEQLFSVISTFGLPRHFDRALDFGSGAGRFLPHFKSRFREVWGVDISREMIEVAKKHNPDCRFYLNSATDLEAFPSEHFDLVYSFLVLQHLPGKAIISRYVSEFIRVLRAGGIAAFQAPEHLGIRWRIQPRRRMYHLLRTVGLRSEWLQSWSLLPMKFTAISKEKVLSTVEGMGGRIVKIEVLEQPEGLMYYCTK